MSTRIVALALGLRGSIAFLAERRPPDFGDDVLTWGPALEQAFDAGVAELLALPVLTEGRDRTDMPDSAWLIALHGQLERLRQPPIPGSPTNFQRQVRGVALHELIDLMGRAGPDFGHTLDERERRLAERARALTGTSHALSLIDAGRRLEEMDGQLRLLRQTQALEVVGVSEPVVCDVAATIEHCLTVLRPLADEHRVDFKTDVRAAGARVLVDEAQLQRSLIALIENGIKYNFRYRDERATWVSIRIRTKRARVVVSIQNWGVRIEDEYIRSNAVFRAGFRGDEARRERAGTGFGLAGVGRFVEQHNGSISLTSRAAHRLGTPEEIERGPHVTTVVLELPLAPASAGDGP